MSEPFPAHPRVTETLAIVDSALAQYDRHIEAVRQSSTTRADATKTVAVTLNHYGWLVDAWIKPGTCAVGAAVLNARLREALAAANADAFQAQQALADRHGMEVEDIIRTLQEVVRKYEQPALAEAPRAVEEEDEDRW
ncbi:hypothetical protein JF729_18365 [Mycobacterium intracellulare]|uniref:hypothetical protein n=1 Tax=Mycobacterium intracellulare TaxID=1767 RepID=UPI001CDA4ED5|nr:hypothetical protein [Mycobacterium intracellulare]MCA2249744.1 hypothetical protein [Mycobacterium intracellulare]